jgi:hypothetical protein
MGFMIQAPGASGRILTLDLGTMGRTNPLAYKEISTVQIRNIFTLQVRDLYYKNILTVVSDNHK